MATILVVDDHATIREFARAVLDDGGHRVLEASDGYQALGIAHHQRPDVIVVDVLMPGIDGYQFVHELRTTTDTADIPVVFYTGKYAEDELEPIAQTHGVSRILLKSGDPRELLDAVGKALHDRPAPVADHARSEFGPRHLQAVNAKLLETAQALDESDARFLTMAEVSPAGIVIGDPDGNATYVNPTLGDITGVDAAELMGSGWLRCLEPDQQPEIRAHLARTSVADGPSTVARHQCKFALDDGRSRWLTVLLRTVWTGERTLSGFVAVIDDVTALVEAEERRHAATKEREAAARRQATERFDSLARLAGGVAHDVNNMLNIILNYGEFARESVAEAAGTVLTDAQAAEILDELGRILDAGKRAGRLAHQLLMLGGREVAAPTSVDVNALVAELQSTIIGAVGPHITVTCDLDETRPAALADAGQLRQALLSLVTNAAEAMPEGGQLRLCTFAACAHAGDPRPPAGGDLIRITVTDTGHGMSPQVLEHALEPFFTTKPNAQGAGLGLATAYGIVKQAGGDLTIDSTHDDGTSVHIYLRAMTHPVEPPAPAHAPPSAPARQTVLVAEDEAGIREVISTILTRAGYQVVSTVNGKEALAAAHTHDGTIDVLLTDVVMPVMNGRELADAFAVIKPHTPILFMSGYAAPLMTGQGLLAPGVTVLSKPFTRDELLAAIGAALAKPSTSAAPVG